MDKGSKGSLKLVTWLMEWDGGAEWHLVYSGSKGVDVRKLFKVTREEVEEEVAKMRKRKQYVLLVLRTRRKWFSRKVHAELFACNPVPNLTDRHNLFVLLERKYAHAPELWEKVEEQFSWQEREERIRTYHVEEQFQSLDDLRREMRSSVAKHPVLILFTVASGKAWAAQRKAYVPVLVDYEEQLRVLEVNYDPKAENAEAVKKAFAAFKVPRTPAWVMATPAREGKATSVRLNRFEYYRDRYFLQQLSEGREEMSHKNAAHVREAFESFVLWGLERVNKYKAGAPKRMNF